MTYSRRLLFIAAFVLAAVPLYAQPPQGRPSLKERAARGDSEAQFNLGKMYEAGRGGLAKDYAEAARWYLKSAEQDDPYAQASLGIFYLHGKGVTKDLVQSYMWFALAASKTTGGEHDTIAEMRDSAGLRMTAQQIAEAKRLASEWKPQSSLQ